MSTTINSTENSVIPIKNESVNMTGAYVGIAFGCLFAVLLIPVTIFLAKKCRRSSNKNSRACFNNIQAHARPSVISLNETYCQQNLCLEFFRSLNLPSNYFDSQHNRCYCRQHYSDKNPKTHNLGGYDYTLPCGWLRIALKCTHPVFQQENIFQTWTTSYHGTSVDQLANIISNRNIPFPGDRLNNGEIFQPKFPEKNCCYTSPSIFYTSQLKICAKYSFKNRQYQVILQCKQKPGTFTINHGQPGLCKLITSDRIKWKTSNRATVIPIGIMIKLIE